MTEEVHTVHLAKYAEALRAARQFIDHISGELG